MNGSVSQAVFRKTLLDGRGGHVRPSPVRTSLTQTLTYERPSLACGRTREIDRAHEIEAGRVVCDRGTNCPVRQEERGNADTRMKCGCDDQAFLRGAL